MHFKKGRKHKNLKHMKSLQDILGELQGLETTTVEGLQAAVAQAITDLQTIVDAAPSTPGADPIVSITTTTQSGVTAEFVPQTA
jgi:hypothetical protein